MSFRSPGIPPTKYGPGPGTAQAKPDGVAGRTHAPPPTRYGPVPAPAPPTVQRLASRAVPPPPTRFGPVAVKASAATAAPATVQRMQYVGNLLQSGWSTVKANPIPFIVGGLLVAGTTLGLWHKSRRERQEWRRQTFDNFLQATHLSEEEYDEGVDNYEQLWVAYLNKSILAVVAKEVTATRGNKTVRQLMDDFVAKARRRNFVYDPNGADCEAIAKTFLAVVGKGKPRYIGSSAVGDVRVLVRVVRPIDESWRGGQVFGSDRSRIAGWVGFQNHWAAEVDGTIYDPTGGYVGDDAGWCRLLTRSSGESYDLDQPLPGRSERHADVSEDTTGKVTRLRD